MKIMKIHSTNYFNTLIEAAADTKVVKGTIPPSKSNKTVAERQYELIASAPYQYTSDDIIFQVYAERRDLTPDEYPEARAVFFSLQKPMGMGFIVIVKAGSLYMEWKQQFIRSL